MKDYISFIETYGKEYNHDNFLTFKNNSKMIENHNNGNHTYTLKINEFSDQKISFNHIIYQPTNSTYKGENLKTTLPYAIDWRKKTSFQPWKIKVIVVLVGHLALLELLNLS